MTLSLPLALGLIVIFLAIGAGTVFFVLRSTGHVVEPTVTVTPSASPTMTTTATITSTPSPLPTWTELPPLEYSIKENDYCSSIAAFFKVSIQSIVLLNNLPPDCGVLSIGQKLLIPQPTRTPSPIPTSTLSSSESTEAACERLEYKVQSTDTLSSISLNYNISIQAIKDENGLPSDVINEGQILYLPLCRRNPTAGPTPTATNPPPYAAPNLLLPADGSVFLAINETITLQWAAVGTLRQNEAYVVIVEDITEGVGRKLTEYVVDTKFIVPTSFRPSDTNPHIIRWHIQPVRQSGTDKEGNAIWEPAGDSSVNRVFIWAGTVVSTPTPVKNP